MTIYVISEESHGFIGTATTFKAAKQFLLASDWINAGISIWVNDRLNEKGDHYFTLKEAYGENWKEVYMDFDMDTLNELGFYLHEEELFEEQEDN